MKRCNNYIFLSLGIMIQKADLKLCFHNMKQINQNEPRYLVVSTDFIYLIQIQIGIIRYWLGDGVLISYYDYIGVQFIGNELTFRISVN